MTQLDLGRADLALLTDPAATRVHIPSLMTMPRRRSREKTLVRFEGDDYPIAFHGLGRSQSMDLSCRYSAANQPLRVALEYLIDELAPAQYDPRLLLRLHVEDATSLPAHLQAFVAAGNSVVIEAGELTSTPLGAAAVDVTFTATVVQHSFVAD